ncbi:MAG: hypothetical protein QOE85_755 [Actinomycetota bacterium]|nr:hypothetical protein [Actinomycetota bacterium]
MALPDVREGPFLPTRPSFEQRRADVPGVLVQPVDRTELGLQRHEVGRVVQEGHEEQPGVSSISVMAVELTFVTVKVTGPALAEALPRMQTSSPPLLASVTVTRDAPATTFATPLVLSAVEQALSRR